MRFQSKLQSSHLALHLSHGRLSNTFRGKLSNWAFTQNQLNKKGCQQSRSLADRWLFVTLRYRFAIPKSTQQRHHPRRGVLTRSFLSKTSCPHTLSVLILRNQDEQLVCFVSFCRRRHRHLLCHQASINHDQSPPVGPRPLDQAPVSGVFQRSHLLSCTHHTKFDAGHVQMRHGVRLQAWSVHVRQQQHWSLNFNSFISNAFIHNLVFNGHELQLSSWRLRRRAAVSLTQACHRTYPLRVCRGLPDCLFRMHPAQFLIASCAPVLLDFGVPDVRLGNVSDTVRMTFGLEPNVRCHDNAESDKERKTTVRVQRARANRRLSAHRSATSVGTNSPFCVILKNISPVSTVTATHCLKHFNSSIDQNQRNERDEDLLFVCLPPLLCPSRTSSATHDHSHGDMGITLEAHVCSRELTQTSPDP